MSCYMSAIYMFRKASFLSFGQRLTVCSLHQLHRLLQQWRLVPSPSSTRTTTSARPSSGLDGRAATTSSEPESRNAYERRPLPSLPRTGSSRRARESNRAPNRPPQTQSGVNQHQHRHRRVEREVGSVSAHEGSSSPLENYVMDPQTHEMIAIGLV